MRFGPRLWSLILLVGLGVPLALACGPEFPWQLLDDRAKTLQATPANSFAFEAARLVRPDDALRAVEPEVYGAQALGERFRDAEDQGLTPEQVVTLRAMREAETPEEVDRRGLGTPAAVRHYVAGALGFQAGDFPGAAERFEAVLRLDEPERRPRGTWAAFMLGRTLARLGETERAAAAFAQTRVLTRAGAPDPLGLAVDSYGQEARLSWQRALARLDEDTLPEAEAPAFAAEVAAAARLYAEQAARGSDSGVQSLRILAARLLELPDTLPVAIADPLVQRLLVAYGLARVGDVVERIYPADGSRPQRVTMAPEILDTLVDAIEARGLDTIAGADRLAALAYRIARYDLAARLAARSPGPLAVWVRAKLALQAGDLQAAVQLYAAARQAAADDGGAVLEPAMARLLGGEGAVAMLARGDHVGALDRLYPLARSYWGDLAHVAERVVTLDELKDFVDAKVPAAREPQRRLDRYDDDLRWSREADTNLRDLLARRLVRAGRFAEATPYFHRAEDREAAAAYGEALAVAARAWWAVDRADAWFDAAVLARRSGMEIMGYEAEPDFAVHGGTFVGGVGQQRLGEAHVTDGERQRFLATAAQPARRYHYRYLAVAHAERAADLLPPRSQAHAAVLCHAAHWMFETGEEDRARALYRRYVRHGAYQPWASGFGHDCPPVDFAAAASFTQRHFLSQARRFLLDRRWTIAALASLALLAAGLWMTQRRTVLA